MGTPRKHARTGHRAVTCYLVLSPFHRTRRVIIPRPFRSCAPTTATDCPSVPPGSPSLVVSVTEEDACRTSSPAVHGDASSGFTLYSIEEVLVHVMRHCDWKTVMSASRVLPRVGLSAARYHVRWVLQQLLSPYVGKSPDVFNGFMKSMQDAGGGITGHIARAVLDFNSEYTMNDEYSKLQQCHVMSIVVPKGGIIPIQQKLWDIGYRSWNMDRVSAPRAMTVERMLSSTRRGVGGQGVSVD